MLTASLIPAVFAAARDAQQKLVVVAAATPGLFKDAKASDLSFTAGSVHHKDQPAASGRPFDKIIAAAKTSSVSGQGRSKGTISDMIGVTKPSFSSQSYVAHFVEVTWEPEIARLRLNRIVTTVDAGRIINELTARNQIEGAVAMGLAWRCSRSSSTTPAAARRSTATRGLYSHHPCGCAAARGRLLAASRPTPERTGRPRHWRNRPGGDRCGDHLRHPPRHRRARARAACPGRGSAAIAGHLSRAAAGSEDNAGAACDNPMANASAWRGIRFSQSVADQRQVRFRRSVNGITQARTSGLRVSALSLARYIRSVADQLEGVTSSRKRRGESLIAGGSRDQPRRYRQRLH